MRGIWSGAKTGCCVPNISVLNAEKNSLASQVVEPVRSRGLDRVKKMVKLHVNACQVRKQVTVVEVNLR